MFWYYTSLFLLLATMIAALFGTVLTLRILRSGMNAKRMKALKIYILLPILLLITYYMLEGILTYTTDLTLNIFLYSYLMITVIATLSNYYLEDHYKLRQKFKPYYLLIVGNTIVCALMVFFSFSYTIGILATL